MNDLAGWILTARGEQETVRYRGEAGKSLMNIWSSLHLTRGERAYPCKSARFVLGKDQSHR